MLFRICFSEQKERNTTIHTPHPEDPEIFAIDPDVSPHENDHLASIGLSECRIVPPPIDLQHPDPLGSVSLRSSSVSSTFYQLFDRIDKNSSSRKPLGEQAACLHDSRARSYALDRVSRAAQVLVSREILFTVLNILCTTLDLTDLYQAMTDLGIQDIDLLLDLMKTLLNEKTVPFVIAYGYFSQKETSQGSDEEGLQSVWKVLSAAIKAFLVCKSSCLQEIVQFCKTELLSEARGKISCLGYVLKGIFF